MIGVSARGTWCKPIKIETPYVELNRVSVITINCDYVYQIKVKRFSRLFPVCVTIVCVHSGNLSCEPYICKGNHPR